MEMGFEISIWSKFFNQSKHSELVSKKTPNPLTLSNGKQRLKKDKQLEMTECSKQQRKTSTIPVIKKVNIATLI